MLISFYGVNTRYSHFSSQHGVTFTSIEFLGPLFDQVQNPVGLETWLLKCFDSEISHQGSASQTLKGHLSPGQYGSVGCPVPKGC